MPLSTASTPSTPLLFHTRSHCIHLVLTWIITGDAKGMRAGLLAFIAQAKYDSIILEIVTFASACVLVVRVVLGYKRMYDR